MAALSVDVDSGMCTVGLAGLGASVLCCFVCLRPTVPVIVVGYIFCVSPGMDEFPTFLRADASRTLWLILVLLSGDWRSVHS